MLRSLILGASNNRFLAARLPRYGFVRRSVSRFMPGETADDAIAAAERAAPAGVGAVLSRLGENVSRREDVDAAMAEYELALDRTRAASADVQLSIKLTQLGLDIDAALAAENLDRLAERAAAAGTVVWIDMESSAYVDRTLEAFRAALRAHRNIGVCVQAYLHRTERDLESLLDSTRAIRLVKGAYREPPSVALTRRQDIDEAFCRLGLRLLNATASAATPADAPAPVLGSHDVALLERVTRDAASAGIGRDSYEIQMLYGIRTADLFRLAGDGFRTRLFICYGPEWYPWFLRRLAERPANLLMVARQLVG